MILGQLCPAPSSLSSSSSSEQQRLHRSWDLCEEILGHFASFSISAHTSLVHLRKFHGNMVSRLSGMWSAMMISTRGLIIVGIDKTGGEPSVPERGQMPSAANQAPIPNPDSLSGPSFHMPGQGYHFNAPLDPGLSAFWQAPGGPQEYGMADGSLLNWDPNLENFIMDFSSDEVPLALGHPHGQ